MRKTRVLPYFPFATSILRTERSLFALLNANWNANKRHAWPRPLHNYIARNSLQLGEEATETNYYMECRKIVLMCRNAIFSILF